MPCSHPTEGSPIPHDRRTIETVLALVAPLARYHRLDVRHLDRIPDGPALLVGNHNSGAGITDGLFLIDLYARFGLDEPVQVLAHEALFSIPIAGPIFEKLGAVPASHENARRAFEKGRKVLVFPGTDFDSMRPFRDRARIVFAGHRGFAKLALDAGVPIVPVVSAGAHETFIVLTQGTKFAKRIGLPERMRWHSMPVTLCLPWGIAVGPASYVPYFPLPAKVTVEIGEPIDPARVAEGEADPVGAVYDVVVDAMQRTLSRLYSERRFPILG